MNATEPCPFARTRLGRAALPIVLLGSVLLGGCGDDGSEEPVAETPDPPEIELLEAETTTGDPVELPSTDALVLGCDRWLSVSIGPNPSRGELKNWLLRPPGSCRDWPQCGSIELVLRISSRTEATRRAASTFITLDVPELPAETDDYELEARLLDDEGEVFLSEDGTAFTDRATIRLSDASGCDEGVGAGAGALEATAASPSAPAGRATSVDPTSPAPN